MKTYRTVRSTSLSSNALGGRSSDNFSLPTPLLHARANTHVPPPFQELGDLRTTLNQEVEQLRTEFQGLRSTLNQQLEATANLASVEDEDAEAKE